MTILRTVFADQLTRNVAALRDCEAGDVVLMVEVGEEATYVRHHKKKIVYLFSAMRHFAEELRADGLTVDYVTLDAKGNSGSFTGEVVRAAKRHQAGRIVATEPGEWRVLEAMRQWEEETGLPVEIRSDDRFLCTHDEFAAWAKDRKSMRMEYFYREMRRRTGYLMTVDGEPEGGQWNYDHDNREALPKEIEVPARPVFEPDEITRDVIALVERRFGNHFGDIAPMHFAVTRADALKALDGFATDHLPRFGDYQDAMRTGEPYLFHAVVSPYINAGLLLPREVCERALEEYEAGRVPLNAIEGFIRQIIGWREYVRGIYWLQMPDYEHTNFLEAKQPLPDFYWTGETRMNCIAQVVGETRAHAYAHHIQRLMVTGTFALLAGLKPHEVEAWYLVVYADAYDWVELPNVHGMILFADGGLLGSKPYAASGQYINRMSDYCKGCLYAVKERTGPSACPFNYLYWDFLDRNRERIGGNQRLANMYRTWDRFTDEKRDTVRADAKAFLESEEMRASGDY